MANLEIDTLGLIRRLTLNRQGSLNALTTPLRADIAAALDAAAEDHDIRCVLLTGAGDRAFCAGQDLRESQALGAAQGPEWMRSWTTYFDAFARFPKPIICAVNGVAAGAGFETTLLADIRLASTSARFLLAEIDIGLPAIFGGYLVNRHLGRSLTTEIVLTGRTMHADEAMKTGLLSRLVEADELSAAAVEMASELSAKPPKACELNIARFRQQTLSDFSDVRARASALQSEAIASGEPQSMMSAFFANRQSR